MLEILLKHKYKKLFILALTHMLLRLLQTERQNFGTFEESCLYLNQKDFKDFLMTLYSPYLMLRRTNS